MRLVFLILFSLPTIDLKAETAFPRVLSSSVNNEVHTQDQTEKKVTQGFGVKRSVKRVVNSTRGARALAKSHTVLSPTLENPVTTPQSEVQSKKKNKPLYSNQIKPAPKRENSTNILSVQGQKDNNSPYSFHRNDITYHPSIKAFIRQLYTYSTAGGPLGITAKLYRMISHQPLQPFDTGPNSTSPQLLNACDTFSAADKNDPDTLIESDTLQHSVVSDNDQISPVSMGQTKTPPDSESFSIPRPDTSQVPSPSALSTFSVNELMEYPQLPDRVKKLIYSVLSDQISLSEETNRRKAQEINQQQIHSIILQLLKTSNNPELLSKFKRQNSCFGADFRVIPVTTHRLGSIEFDPLRPGDLLLWTCTHAVKNQNQPCISHLSLYLGRRKKDGKPVMAGLIKNFTGDGFYQYRTKVVEFALLGKSNLQNYPTAPVLVGYCPIPGLWQNQERNQIQRIR